MSRITCSDKKPDRHERNTFWLDTKTGILYRCDGTEEYKQIAGFSQAQIEEIKRIAFFYG